MGHAKRRLHERTPPRRNDRLDDSPALDDNAVERILEQNVARDAGDPIAGIRNALIASMLFWVTLALALIYL